MGYLVEGIGDEVLFFGAFLGFSACVVVLVNFWRDRTNREGQARHTPSSGKELYRSYLRHSLVDLQLLFVSESVLTRVH